jgi:hypothetical protein
MSSKLLYIFDLDGTLADIEHRRPILEDKNNPNRWDEFYAACVNDTSNEPVLTTLWQLIDGGLCDIIIFSGRSEAVREETIEWLEDRDLTLGYEIKALYMRPIGNHTPDEVLKKQWLDSLTKKDRNRLVAVFDDRDKVVKMWRNNGIPCFQVAPGDF